MDKLFFILLFILMVGCNNSGVFEPGGEEEEETSLVVSTEKLTGYSASNNLGAYLDSNKTINQAFALIEAKTYMSDVVNNASDVNSGDDVPTAINAILNAIEVLRAPIGGNNFLLHVESSEVSIEEELTKLADKFLINEKPKSINTLLYKLIREQQKEISQLKIEVKNLTKKTHNLY